MQDNVFTITSINLFMLRSIHGPPLTIFFLFNRIFFSWSTTQYRIRTMFVDSLKNEGHFDGKSSERTMKNIFGKIDCEINIQFSIVSCNPIEPDSIRLLGRLFDRSMIY